MTSAEAFPTALYIHIKDEIRNAILSGELKPFDRLPSESNLRERFSVSRITVRQALSELHKEGLIFTIHGKGSFVSKPKADQGLSSLQGFAEAMAEAGHETVNQVLDLREIPADAIVSDKLRLPAGTPVVEIKRLRFLNRSPISVDITYVPLKIGHRLAKADLATRDIFLILENDLGLALGNAELAIEATGADDYLAQHLKIPRGAPLLRIERLTYTRDGHPLDFEYLFYRGDAFRYRLTIERQASPRSSA
ncbi:GntR family transcriptional regulator [Skermanella stibiiresistens SB22]|uniref:GntR family transcriptional regulator n=1 Tax=Skermanella stibiiresistens SB22 TaxID=1385369 RepID=W9HAM6_9PROT|nr:GntR family transcriptional regulator [Skermanella stibiiresistens]EWY41791.1 GntR family transcriptional regulator [Skermanella stibiiresistens SB22]